MIRFGFFALSAALCGTSLPARERSLPPAPQSSAPLAPQGRTAAADPHHDSLLIFPFENGSKMASLDWMGEGLAEATAERLEDRQVNVLSREDRLATLERMGLPDSARFSHATIIKIAGEADADDVVYGRFESDGKSATLEARVLHLNPPSLSAPLRETGAMSDLLRVQARLSWQILCALDKKQCPAQGSNRDESSFSEPPPSLTPEALENFVHGLTGSEDDERLRSLREAARLEPAWDRPAFELGQIYFNKRDCDSALVWYSRVPPNRPDGPEASFATGVCHLARNDPARANAAFSGLLERSRKSGEKGAVPEMAEMRNNLGVSLLRLGKWNEAGAEFERAAALDSEDADYWVNIALTKLIGKQAPTAVAPLERARKIDPDDKVARSLLIATLESLGRAPEVAAIRSEVPPETPEKAAADKTAADKTAPPNVQDAAALSKLVRVSRTLDRTQIRPGDSPDHPSSATKQTRSPAAGGARP